MHVLARRVHRFIRARHLIADADRVAIGVSGGADSVALALLLVEVAGLGRWTAAGLVHVHHGLRPDADADADFVLALGVRLGLPVDVSRVDVPALARAARRSIEATARDARYRSFEEAATRLGATVVATGHTMDDQAETVLLRLLRGTGTRGVSAIRPRLGRFVRPLLGCRRQELRGFLEARSEAFREDPSNRDLTVPRNGLRHRLMPVIEELAPGGVPALARLADLAADDEAWLTDEVRRHLVVGVRMSAGGVELNRAWLNALPPALGRRVVRDAVERMGGVVTFRDVAAVLALSGGARSTGALDLHRVGVRCSSDVLVLARAGAAPAPVWDEAVLPIPGQVDFGDVSLTARLSDTGREGVEGTVVRVPGRAILQASTVAGPLVVRSRRAGDRLRPLGSPGRRKVQDVFVDRKVPRAGRDRVPIVVDATGRIVWIADVAIAHECRVTAPEAGMVILELEKRHP